MANNEQIQPELISWEFPEFSPKPRNNSWYVWYGIIAALLISSAIVTDNYLFAVIILLFTIILFLQNWRKPDRIRFTITPSGIEVGRSTYQMRDIKEFWIAYEPPEVEMLYFQFKSSLRPVLGIPLEGNNPLQIREILLDYVAEDLDREEEPASDGIARILNLY